jgi:stage V sporulation protein R
VDEFLTEDFCIRNKLFVYKFNKRTNKFEVDTRDFRAIKAKLLFHMTNFGQPIIRIEDANFENRSELLLTHLHEGIDLQPDFMNETLKNVQKIWNRPVNLITSMENDGYLYRYDGKELQNHKLTQLPQKKEKE